MEGPVFGILGPLEVRRGGDRIHLGPSLRAVLSALLVRANQPVPGAKLRAVAWADGARPSMATVRSHVHHLRQALEPARLPWAEPSMLVTTGDGYMLRLRPDQLDAARFERLVDEGLAALAAGERAAAAAALRAGLGLWRGPALAGLEGSGETDEELAVARVRLEERRDVAREALDRAEPAVARSRPPDTSARRAEPLAAAARPRQLPPGPAHFIGRTVELEVIRAHLTPSAGPAAAVAAIDGTPGVGKSALALYLAHQLASEFPDGVLYRRLSGPEPDRAPSSKEVLDDFLRELGVPEGEIPDSLQAASARYRTALAPRRVLVVLDDTADAAQVRPLLAAGPGCATLITSRARLTLPEALPFRLGVLSEAEALEMLDRLDGTGRVPRDPASAAEIARACGLLPLALQIAAARLGNRPSWTTADLARRLTDEQKRLRELQLGDLDVRACFELSYHGLAPDEARGFRLLGLLDMTDIIPAAAAELFGFRGDGADRAETVLERLLDEQLLEQEQTGRYRFHDLLRLFARERVGAEEPAAECTAARRRVLAWFLAAVEQADEFLKPSALREAFVAGPLGAAVRDRDSAIAWLETERDNLVAAVRQAAEQDDPEIAPIVGRLGDALFRFFDLRKHWADWLAVCEPAVQAARRTGDRTAEGWALNRLGAVLREQGQVAASIARLMRALALGCRLDDPVLQSTVLNNLGIAYQDRGDLERAVRCHERRLVLARAADDRVDQAVTLNNLGDIFRQQRRFEQANSCFQESLATFTRLDDLRSAGMVLHNLGEMARQRHRHQEAIAYHEQGLRHSRKVGDRFSEAHNLLGLGEATARTRGRAAALPLWRLAHAILHELGAPEAEHAARLLLLEEEPAGATANGDPG